MPDSWELKYNKLKKNVSKVIYARAESVGYPSEAEVVSNGKINPYIDLDF